ncbi:MAG TPA: PrsW family glutamic-type intramembrane protease [Dictyobacter sp.]|nr:PrsW family glutamic-type intramembrane protease [Dictyobacter sp.]
MASENQGFTPDTERRNPSPSSSLSTDRHDGGENTQPRYMAQPSEYEHYEEPMYREHVSQPLNHTVPPTPHFYPVEFPEQQYRAQQEQRQAAYNQPTSRAAAQTGSQNGPAQNHPARPYRNQSSQQQAPYYPSQSQQWSGGYQPPMQNGGYYYHSYPPGYYGYGQPYGYGYGYPGQMPYASYPYQPYWHVKPSRDTYLFVIAIVSTICSGLVLLAGLICAFILLFALVAGNTASSSNDAGQLFGGVVMLTALSLAGLAGGGFGFYHSIRALARKRSRPFKLPRFWIFLLCYLVLLVIGFLVRGNTNAINDVPLSILLIGLAGLLPALTILALGVRRLHFPDSAGWPTTWRRLAVALISGATSAIFFAMIFELILSTVVGFGLHLNSFNLSDPNQNIPDTPQAIIYMLLVASVIAPLVEETVKPLAVVALIGRINSAAEAFLLGLGCGIGFDLIETSGYISMGYKSWVDVAIERSTAGLLHGFGAGMVSLGWYLITHRNAVKKHHILLGLSCYVYAIMQHAIWNGSSLITAIPGPIGNFFANGQIMIGSYPLQAQLLIYLFWSTLMIIFFLYVTGKLSGRSGWGNNGSSHPEPIQTAPNNDTPQRTEPQMQPVGVPAGAYPQYPSPQQPGNPPSNIHRPY